MDKPTIALKTPVEPLTMPRQFAAVFNGKIYVGKPDTDPTASANQITVYHETEEATLIPIAQPIGTNVGGYPVINGQFAKLAVTQDYSLAVFDQYGAQVYYFPRCDGPFVLHHDDTLEGIGTKPSPLKVRQATLTQTGISRLTDLTRAEDKRSTTVALTPLGLRKVTDPIEENLSGIENDISHIGSALGRVGNLQVDQVNLSATTNAPGKVTLIVPTDTVKVLLIGHYDAAGVESRDRWTNQIFANGVAANTTTFSGYVTGSAGHGHHRTENLSFSALVDMQLKEGAQLGLTYTTTRSGTSATFTVFYLQGATTPEADTPTAVIVTPTVSQLNTGGRVQLAANVLPANIAGSYPVSWSVSDASLGSVDANGLYTSTAGQSGTQSIIASVSTGLASTATVSQYVYLTGITIGTVPTDLITGNSYHIPLSYTPATYTEPVTASSSDPNVAYLSPDGTLKVTGVGPVTLTLTGAYSGKTASVTVAAREEVKPETYLKITHNLAEIAHAGEDAQAEARRNLRTNYTVSVSPPPEKADGYEEGHLWYQVEG